MSSHNQESARRALGHGLALLAAVACLVSPTPGSAVMTQRDETSVLQHLAFVDASLQPTVELMSMSSARYLVGPEVSATWSKFAALHAHGGQWQAQVDRRSGLIEIAEGPGIPWIPGRGNSLKPVDIAAFAKGRPQLDMEVLESIARDFVGKVDSLVSASAYDLRLNPHASGQVGDHIWFVEFDAYVEDLKIEGARVFFRVNNGNLIQFGAEKVPAPGSVVPDALVSRAQAHAALASYVGLIEGVDRFVAKTALRLLPVPAGRSGSVLRPAGRGDFAFGRGYELLPVWEFVFRRGDEHPTWRARVDAVSGKVTEFLDLNRYSQVTGGYWPVAWKVNGATIPQVSTGWPFTDVNPLAATTNTSGLYSWDGSPQTATHTGPFVNIVDTCGAAGTASSDGSGNIDFGTFTPPNASTPGDCTVQLGISGNTPAARQQYWHVNKIKEKARAYFPANTWLQQQLTANVNINLTCNAFWNGATLNFYRTNGGCYNLGANAGVSMHEWGHGFDSNDGNGSSIDNGTGETYGDFSGTLQTLNSCIGNGILVAGVCGGYGNPCVAGGCDGVRDIDWGRHTADAPMTVANFTQTTCPNDGIGGSYVGPCGLGASFPNNKEGHCESYVSSGALWDFAAADLQSGCTARNGAFPDYSCDAMGVGAGGPYNQAGAWGVVDRLWYLSRPTANQAFTCNRTNPTWTSDGCNAGSNWKTMRAVDDDDGNLANGTPHSCQLAAAFDRHGIACTTDAAWDVCFRGCPQPTAPTLDPPGVGNNQLTLTWTPDTAPDVVDIFRNETGCGFGFAKVAEDVAFASLPYVDNEVANGTTYYYQVVRHPVGNEACGSAPSNCVSATPVAGPSAKYVPDSATLISVPVDNDSDGFVDNCETGRIQVGVVNDGSGALTNVRFTVTSPEAAVTVTTGMPVGVGNLALSSQTTGNFDFSLDGATCGQILGFDISVTADEMTGSNPDSFTHGPAEQDLVLTPSRTDDFETDNDGWTLVQGYARESLTAASGIWSVHSSNGLNDQNDAALSPIFQKGAGATEIVIAEHHDIEAPFWDRANVHAIRLSDGSHTLLTPTGRTYTAGGPWNPVGHVGTEPGWAGTDLTWADATFDLSGLVANESYQLEINYNTDELVVGTGHWFDNVRWTNVSFQECDAQSDLCTPCTPPATPSGLTAAAIAANEIQLDWNAVAPAPTNYRIYRATTSGGPYGLAGSVGGGTLTFTDAGLTPGVTYYYVVRAFDLCESADSNEASETAFGDCSTPPTFGGLGSVAPISAGGSCGLRLGWSPGVNNCNGDPLVYNVYRSTTSGFSPGPGNLLQPCVTDTFFDDTSVTGGMTYNYVVRAEDSTVGNNGLCQTGNEEGNTTEVSGTPPTGAPVLLYDQTANLSGSGYNSQSYGDLPTFSNERGADFVVAVGGWSVSRVVANGFYSAAGTAPTIDVRFYADNGGAVPLSLPQDPAVCTYAGLVSGIDFTDTAGLFDVTLPSTCALPAGRHWASVVANRDFNPIGVQWFWRGVTVIGGSEHAWRNPGDGFGSGCINWSNGATTCTAADPDVAFQVWGPGSSCTLAPAAVPFLTATATANQNVVEWLNPSAGGYGSTMTRWSTSGFPADPTDGTLLVDQNDGLGNKGSATHASLTNGATYYYSAFVDNGAGEYSARRTVSARPFDTSGNVAWAYSTGASALAPPGIGSVYAVANDRVLHSADTLGTGTWPAGWTPMVMNGPAQARLPIVPTSLMSATKVAFLGSQDGRAYAVDADTGQQLWASPLLPPSGSLVQASPVGSFAVFGGIDRLMVGTRHSSADNQMHGLDLADGTIAWSFTNSIAQDGDGTGIGIISSGASLDLAGNRLYFANRARSGGSQDTVWCLSFTAGTVTKVWSRAIGDIDGSPILHNGRIYVGTNSGQARALDALTGADLWAAPFDSGDGPIKGYLFPRFGTSDLFFSTTNTVWSISDDGAGALLNWSDATVPSPSIPLVSFANSFAWVGGGNGRLYQIDFSGGSPALTSIVLGDGTGAVGSPALDVSSDTAYVGTDAGKVYPVTLPLP